MRTSFTTGSTLSGMLRGSLAALLLALASRALTACGSAPTAAIDAAEHRARSEDGWVRLGGEGLHFTMPGEPEVRRRREDNSTVTVFSLHTEADSRGFEVEVFDLGAALTEAAGAQGLDALERRMRQQFPGSACRRVREGLRDGLRMRDLETEQVTIHGHVAYTRLIDGGRYLVAMTVVHLPDEGSVEDDLRRFRESLRIDLRRNPQPVAPDLD